MMRKLLGLLLISFPAFAQVSSNVQVLGTTGSAVVTFNWTGSGTGTVPSVGAPLGNQFQGYFVTQVETVPLAPAPIAGYSVAVTDNAGVDVLAGAASNLSATLPQGFATACVAPPINGTLSLAISNQTNAGARGIVYVFLQAQCIPGSGSSATIGVSAGVPSNPCATAGLLDINQANGNLYSCPTSGGNWVLVSGNSTILTGAGAPTNPCATLGTLYENTTNGLIYSCPSNGGNWLLGSQTPVQNNLGNITGAVSLPVTLLANNAYSGTLTGNITATQAATPSAGADLSYDFTENGTGGWDITWPSGFSVVPTLSAANKAANCENTFYFTWDGAKAVFHGAFSTCPSSSATVTDEINFNVARDVTGIYMTNNTDGANVSAGITQADLQADPMSNVGTPYMAIHHRLHSNWTGNIDIKIFWTQTSGGSGTVQFDVQTWCTANGGSLASTSYNAAQSQSPATAASNILVETDQLALTTTGCAAGNQLVVKVSRNNTVGGNYASPINLYGITLVVRHT